MRGVVEHGYSAVLIASGRMPDPRVVYINPAFEQATGYSRADVAGRRLSALAGLASVQRRFREERPFLEEVSVYQTAQGERWGEWRVVPVKDRTGRAAHWLVIFRDITEGKRLEKEILEISDRERQRIGQDLHDGLCQQLAGLELMSQVLQQQLASKSKTAAARAGQIASHVREAISQTRLLARGLYPVALDAGGLMPALVELAANTQTTFGTACRVESDRPLLFRDPAVATHLCRIAQEAVLNAIKHGKATEIVIRLGTVEGRAVLDISDNGAGFPQVSTKTKGMGLRIMQHRAAMIGGVLKTCNLHAGGARVSCSVPL
jgi:PAS domain S-box-containing protein